MKRRPQWIKETEAAEMLGYKPIVLRKYAKSGKLSIAFHTIKGRKFQYDRTDIENLMLKHSTFLQ
jgi:predicted site-specific integrase-resolvase